MSAAAKLRAFLAAHDAVAKVEVSEAKGSTPREQGAWMLVSQDAIFGTIGGGQLEFMAIDRAREVLADVGAAPHPPAGAFSLYRDGEKAEAATPMATTFSPLTGRRRRQGDEGRFHSQSVELSIPLGPEIGQCCGGRVGLEIAVVDETKRNELLREAKAEDAALPQVYLFGGGHVGHALANVLALLPVKTIVVETRAEALEGMPDAVEAHLTPVPEDFVRHARTGAAFVVLTHDHALDFLIVAEALGREDAAYVGMIGSATKKATFKSWYLKTAGGTEANFARLVTPIGGDQVKDKRPAVIAAMAAAEIMRAVSYRQRR